MQPCDPLPGPSLLGILDDNDDNGSEFESCESSPRSQADQVSLTDPSLTASLRPGNRDICRVWTTVGRSFSTADRVDKPCLWLLPSTVWYSRVLNHGALATNLIIPDLESECGLK